MNKLQNTLLALVATASPGFAQDELLYRDGAFTVVGRPGWSLDWPDAPDAAVMMPNGNVVLTDAGELVELQHRTGHVVRRVALMDGSFERLEVRNDGLLVLDGDRVIDRNWRTVEEVPEDSGEASTAPLDVLWKAREIHWSTITLDTHKDIRPTLATTDLPDDPAKLRGALLRDDPTFWGTNQVDFPKMRSGGLDVAYFIVYVGQGSLDDEGFERAKKAALMKFDAIERMCERFPEHIELAHTADDVERIAAAGKLVACIGIENGYAMGKDLSLVEEFRRRGARYMSLTHNRHSQLGDSNTPADAPIHGGLSELGKRAIEEMNLHGIMVDVSHAGPKTTLQAIAHSKAPVIASHSGCDGVFEHGRNLSDAELMALKENGGVLQCVAFASYVKDDGGRRDFIVKTREELGLPAQRGRRSGEAPPEQQAKLRELRERVKEFDAKTEKSAVKHFADHIDYAVEKMGIDHVAISSDFDGGGGVEGWSDASETFNVTYELVERGYTAEQIGKIWSGNTLRVMRDVERVAKELQAESD